MKIKRYGAKHNAGMKCLVQEDLTQRRDEWPNSNNEVVFKCTGTDRRNSYNYDVVLKASEVLRFAELLMRRAHDPASLAVGVGAIAVLRELLVERTQKIKG